MKRFLLVSPYFPPMGVSGAKRPLHLSRNLPGFGWEPVVLASRAGGEVVDESLLDKVPGSLIVSYGYTGRLRSWLHLRSKGTRPAKRAGSAGRRHKVFGQDLAFLSPFDRFLLDTPAGIREGTRLVREHGLEAIHVMADPWSGLIAARRIRRRTGLPLIVDFRDPWSLHEGKMGMRPALARRMLRAFEAGLFSESSKVVLNTEACRLAYAEAYAGRLPECRFTTVRNAFDPGLFRDGPAAGDSRFTVLYFGTFRLFVGPEQLLTGFGRFVQRAGLAPKDAVLRFVGGLRDEDRNLVREAGVGAFVEVVPPVPFTDSLPLLRGADVLLIVIEPDCRLQIPGKLYDYLASGRPVLAVSANREVNELLERTGAGRHAAWGDPDAVAASLSAMYAASRRGGRATVDPAAVERFSAREQARSFARILDEVTAG